MTVSVAEGETGLPQPSTVFAGTLSGWPNNRSTADYVPQSRDFSDAIALIAGTRPDAHYVAAIAPSKFEFLINLASAEALGLTIPPKLLAPRRRGDRRIGVAFVLRCTRRELELTEDFWRCSGSGSFQFSKGL